MSILPCCRFKAESASYLFINHLMKLHQEYFLIDLLRLFIGILRSFLGIINSCYHIVTIEGESGGKGCGRGKN